MRTIIYRCRAVLLTLLISQLICTIVYAQSTDKMSYQAVIRNSSDQLVANKLIGIKISILQGSATGTPVYTEVQTPTTNANGLVSIEIGGDAGYSSINWANGPYFIKTETDPTGGSNYSITGTSELLSVPYAILAKAAETVDYNFLTNKPILFDGQYYNLTGIPSFSNVATSGSFYDLLDMPTFFSGSFTDLTNRPTTLSGYGIVDAFDGNYGSLTNKPILFDGAWTSIMGKPTFATVATSGSYSDLLNRPSLFSGSFADLTSKPTTLSGYGIVDAFDGNYGSLTNKPTLFDGAWTSIMGKPSFAAVATSGSYSDLLNRPQLFSGSFTDLTSRPTTLSGYGIVDGFDGNYGSLTNKPTLFDGAWASITGKPTFAVVATSGSYSDLLNRPSLFSGSFLDLTSKPTTLSGYGIVDAFDGNYSSLTNKPTLFDGAWASITGKPTFATVATSGSYSDLANKPTGNNPGDIQYWNGTTWVILPAGTVGQVLTMSATNTPTWQNANVVPTASIQAATNVLMSTSTLNGNVVANGFSTTAIFEYGTTIGYGSNATAIQSPITGYNSTNVNADINSLLSNTTYHFRLKSTNVVGVSYSNDMTFTTSGQAPTATTNSSTSIAGTSATLNGTVNANGFSTVVSFEYGTTIGYGSTATATQSPVTGSSNTNVSSPISGLVAGTTYHFRVKAVNSIGTTYGNDLTFTTLGQAPSATSLAATSITSTGATLNGTVNANYLSTTVTFEWGLTTGYGSTVTAAQSPVTGSTITSVNKPLTGLILGTTYHFRVKAVNSLGTTYSNDQQFIATFALGETYAGGIIFYLDGTGQHGLVCASTDQSTGAAWGCYGTVITGADGTVTGTGNQNTTDIITDCTTVGIAAQICYDLNLNGYTDWFLPSKDELGLMYTNLKSKGLGGLSNTCYWSSSEFSDNNAWVWCMDIADTYDNVKNSSASVRAVRAF